MKEMEYLIIARDGSGGQHIPVFHQQTTQEKENTYSNFSVLKWINPLFILSYGLQPCEQAASNSAVNCLIFPAATPPSSAFSLQMRSEFKKKKKNQLIVV